MKLSIIYTATIVGLWLLFLSYVSRSWGGNHWPLFGTALDRFLYNYGTWFKPLAIVPLLLFSYKDIKGFKPLALISVPLMAVVVWLCISNVLWVMND